MKRLDNLLDPPGNALMAFACMLTLLMMVHVVADVTMKYVFHAPILGTLEIVAGYYMVAVVFFPLAYVARTEGHIIVELFTRGLRRRTILRLDGTVGVLGFVFMSIFTWNSIDEAIRRTRQGQLWEAGDLVLPIWPSRWGLAIGALMLTIYLLVRVFRDFRDARDGA